MTSLDNNLLTLYNFSENLESIDLNLVCTISAQNCKDEVVPESFFSQFQNLRKVILSSHVRWIRDNAFKSCLKLETVRFERNKSRLKVIGNSAFYDCIQLQKIHLTANLSHIGHSAFYSCKSLESMNIPSSVNFIGISAFRDCENLNAIKFGHDSQLTKLNESTFQNSGLQTITLPSSITIIGPSCFNNCSKLESVKLPSSVQEIYNMAFAYCPRLISVKYKSSENVDICCDAFLGSKNMKNTYTNATSNELLSHKDKKCEGAEIMFERWKTQTTTLVPSDVSDNLGFVEPETDTEDETENKSHEEKEQEREIDSLHEELTVAYEKGDHSQVELIIKRMSENEKRKDPDRQVIIKELNQSIDFLQKQLIDVQNRMESSKLNLDEDRDSELKRINKQLRKKDYSKEMHSELMKRKELLHVEKSLIMEYDNMITGTRDKLRSVFGMIEQIEEGDETLGGRFARGGGGS